VDAMMTAPACVDSTGRFRPQRGGGVCDSGACRPGSLFFLGGALAPGSCAGRYTLVQRHLHLLKRVSSLPRWLDRVIGPSRGHRLVCAGGASAVPSLRSRSFC